MVGTVEQQFRTRLQTLGVKPTYTCATLDEARNCLADIRLKEQDLRLLKSDIKLHMQHVRSNYTTRRATIKPWPFKYRATFAANERSRLTRLEAKELAPFEQLTHQVDAVIQALEHVKLDINHWMTAYKQTQPHPQHH